MISDAAVDPRFMARESVVAAGIRSALCVPLWDNKAVIGVLYADRLSPVRPFNEKDLRLLTLLANLAAVKIENAVLMEDAVKKERMERELALAARIQKDLLPKETPLCAELDISGRNVPCLEVGGDYYDVVPSSAGDRVWLVVADISGKGVSAGLIASNVQAYLWSRRADPRPLEVILREGNDLLYRLTKGRKYATAFVAEWRPVERTLTWVGAGHPPMLLRRDGAIRHLDATGGPLGLLPGLDYTSGSIPLGAGDTFLMCTDGVFEAGVEAGLEDFGVERTEACFTGAATAGEVAAAVAAALDRYLAGAHPHDDVTMLCARCL